MENQLQIFDHPEFGAIRTLVIDNDPWFVGKDVAVALKYENPTKAIRDHIDDEDKKMGVQNVTPSVKDNLGRDQYPTFINESGLYSLILSSKLPTAKQFKRWVTSEVLPSIRKTGGYISGQETLTDTELMAKALMVAQKTIAARDARISALTVENSALAVDNQVMRPKADYFDELVSRNLLTSFRETAKQLDVKEKAFITFLMDHKYIYRDQKGKLMPYAEKNNGLFEVKECFNEKTK